MKVEGELGPRPGLRADRWPVRLLPNLENPGYSGFRVSGFGIRVSGSGFGVSGEEVSGFEFRVSGSRFRGPGFGVRASGSGSGVRVSGFEVQILG